jgi:hypothetical protein
MIWESEMLCSTERMYLNTGAQLVVPAFLQDLRFNPIKKVFARKLYLLSGCLMRPNILSEVYV